MNYSSFKTYFLYELSSFIKQLNALFNAYLRTGHFPPVTDRILEYRNDFPEKNKRRIIIIRQINKNPAHMMYLLLFSILQKLKTHRIVIPPSHSRNILIRLDNVPHHPSIVFKRHFRFITPANPRHIVGLYERTFCCHKKVKAQYRECRSQFREKHFCKMATC